MAIYHLHCSHGSRQDGQSGRAKLLYVLRRGKYARGREDLVAPGWSNLPKWCDDDPLPLFAAADLYERSNGRLYVELEGALPVELGLDPCIRLVRAMADRVGANGLPCAWGIHVGRPTVPGEPRNRHFHLVFLERINDGIARDPARWFRRANRRDPAAGGAAKDRRLKGHEWLPNIRRVYERLLNEALERAGHPVRVTAESHRVRIVRAEADGDHETADYLRRHPPGVHIGPTACAIERGRRGRPGPLTERGDLARTRKAEGERLDAALESVGNELQDLLRAAVAAARDAGVDYETVAAAQSDDPDTMIALEEATETRRQEIRATALAVGFDNDAIERTRREAEPDSPDLGWTAVVEATAERREQKDAAESAARSAGVDVEAVYAEARERNENPLDYLKRATAAQEEWIVKSARAVLLDNDEIEGIRREAESKERGSGWEAVVESTAERREQKDAAESAARSAGVDVEAVYAEARERNENPLDILARETEECKRVVAAAHAALLDDDAITRIRREAESKKAGSGWAAVETATNERAEKKQEAEAAARTVGVDMDAAYRHARERNDDPLDILARETEECKRIVGAAHAALLDDDAITRIRREAESKKAGLGWAAVESATSERAKQKQEAEAVSRVLDLDLDVIYANAARHGTDPVVHLKRVITDEVDRRETEIGTDRDGDELLRRARLEVLDVDRQPETLPERSDILVAAEANRDSAIVRRKAETERRRKAEEGERRARIDRQFAAPGGDRDFFAALDQTRPDWRTNSAPATDVNRALDIAESSSGRSSQSTGWHTLVVDTEKAYLETSSRIFREVGSAFAGTDDVDRHAREVSHRLADRARVREIVGGRSERPAPTGLVQRLVEWLRAQIVRLLDTLRRAADPTPSGSRPLAKSKTMPAAESPPGSAQRRPPTDPVRAEPPAAGTVAGQAEKADLERAADEVMAALKKTPRARDTPREYWVPAVCGEVLNPAPDAERGLKDVYAEVRDRLDRRAEAADSRERFDEADRERSQERYLEPLIDGTLKRQQRALSMSSESPRPTWEWVRADVVRAYRSTVEEIFLLAYHRAAGRDEEVARIEMHRKQVDGAADKVMAALKKTPRARDTPREYWVPAVCGEVLNPAPDAERGLKDVYAEVRDRLDRRAEAADSRERFDEEARERSQERYLEPLIDGTLKRQQRALSMSSESPRPTWELVRADVVRAYRSTVEEIFLLAYHRAAGRDEEVARIEMHRKQVDGAAEEVMAALKKTPRARDTPREYWVPAVCGEVLNPAPDAERGLKDVYAEVRDRFDRRAEVADSRERFDEEARERSQERYLEPLIDGTLKRQQRALSMSSESPRPTWESVRADVVEAYRSTVEEIFLLAYHRAAGRDEEVARIEMHRKQVDGAAEEVMAALEKTPRARDTPRDYWVPAVCGEVLNPAPDAERGLRDVYAEVRDRLDRRAEVADSRERFDEEARERSQERYLEPLIDGTLKRQQRALSMSSESPRPTWESVRADVVEAYRSTVEEIFLLAYHRAAGRDEEVARIEMHRKQVDGAAEEVMAALEKTPRARDTPRDYWVPTVYGEELNPAHDDQPSVKDVYAEVRDRLDRRAEAADSRERFDEADRERSQERYLDSLIAETQERQRRAGLAPESASPPQRRENAREQHRARVRSIFLDACRKHCRDAPLIDRRADHALTPPPAAEPAPPTESVRVNGDDGSMSDDHVAGQSGAEPAGQAAGRTQADEALPPTVPDEQAMPSKGSKSARTSADRVSEGADERPRQQSGPAQPATPSEGTTPRPGADRRAQGDSERDGVRPRPSRAGPGSVVR